jgi:tetratricopeptide (TPR) repeat protein
MADGAAGYNVAAIRELLEAAFTAEELARFCMDRPVFRPLLSQFGARLVLADMVQTTIVFCEKRVLLGELLAGVEEVNPAQYELSEGRVRMPRYEPEALPDVDVLPEVGELPPGSRLPFGRNALFTGREEALKGLARALLYQEGQRAVVTQAVQGMGGVGKTQLAVEFAHRYGRFFRGVHWVNAAKVDLIGAEVAALGARMGLPDWPEELPAQVDRTLEAWRGRSFAGTQDASFARRFDDAQGRAQDSPRLVILDNLEDVEAADDWLRRLAGGGVRVVLTARRGDWPKQLGLEVLRLDVFRPGESQEFLRKHLGEGRATAAELDALGERLGFLALALQLAGRYLARVRTVTVAEYVGKLEEALAHRSMAGWREDLPDPVGHDLDLGTTFAVSWEQLEDERARRLFLMAGWCAPNEAIPCEVLERAAGLEAEECGEALAELVGLGLLEWREGEAGPRMHPLLAEFARGLVEEGVPGEAEVNPVGVLADALGWVAYEANMTGLPATYTPLRTHVEAVAGHAETTKPLVAGSLWGNAGFHLYEVADYAGARAALERALSLFSKELGSEHREVATTVNNLGLAAHAQGDLEAAQAAYERALAIWETELGPEHSEVGVAVNNLGRVLQDVGDQEGALEAFARALAIWEKELGPEHPRVATAINNLGLVLRDMGDYERAREAFERAIAIDEGTFGPEHPNVGLGALYRGDVLYAMDDYAGAREVQQQALGIFEAAYGREHPLVATALYRLGSALNALGEVEGARAAFEEALEIFEKRLPAGHPKTERVRGDLESLDE